MSIVIKIVAATLLLFIGACRSGIETTSDRKFTFLSLSNVNHDTTLECKKWKKLNAKEVSFIAERMDSTSNEDAYQSFNTYPCDIRGEVFFRAKKYRYELNAGGVLSLYTDSNTTTFCFVANDSSLTKYFISTVINMED